MANGGDAVAGAGDRFRLRLVHIENAGEDRLPIVAALQEAFAVMPSRDVVEDRKVRARAYLRLLDDTPVWAAVKAIENFMRGDAGDGKWLPTPGEIIQEAKRLKLDFDLEATALRKAIENIESGKVKIVEKYAADRDDY